MDERERAFPRWGETIEAPEVEYQPWRWRSLRSFGISVGLWPIEWELGIDRGDDRFGGRITALVGPLEFTFSYNDGSALRAKSS